MSYEAIEMEISKWDEAQLTRLVNRAVEIRKKFRKDFMAELSAKLDDPDPSRWVSLEDSSPYVRPAGGEDDGLDSGCGVVLAHECKIGGAAVALHGTAPAAREDGFQARSGAAGVPCEDGVASGTRTGPQVAEPGLAVAGFEACDRRFSICTQPPPSTPVRICSQIGRSQSAAMPIHCAMV